MRAVLAFGRISIPKRPPGRRKFSTTFPRLDADSSALPKPHLNYRDIADRLIYKSHNAFNRKAAMPIGAVQTTAKLYSEQKALMSQLNAKRASRSAIPAALKAAGKDVAAKDAAIEEGRKLKRQIQELEQKVDALEDELLAVALTIPNDTHPLTPLGPEAVAVVLNTYGPPPIAHSSARDHVEVGKQLEMIDFKRGATVTGSSWYFLQNSGALLEQAIISYAFSVAMRHGFKPMLTPDVVKVDIAQRCGFQPRQADPDSKSVAHMYQLEDTKPSLVLTGTAEIPLAGSFACTVHGEKELPAKVVGLSRSFRPEAGARGADTRGLYRVHQFSKVELFAVTDQASSEAMMQTITDVQIEIFQGLGLSFRLLDMPTEELGATAYRKFDIEAWMPGRGAWGEISSTSNCTDYQARRLHIRYRTPTAQSAATSPPILFAHTLNGTAAAIPRLIIALLEGGVVLDETGSKAIGLTLPTCLQPFWIGPAEEKITFRDVHTT